LLNTWTQFGFAFRVAHKERDALHKWLDAWVVIALAAWFSGVIETLRKTSELLRQLSGTGKGDSQHLLANPVKSQHDRFQQEETEKTENRTRPHSVLLATQLRASAPLCISVFAACANF
jgi:hypothetical protein